jgi:hypothetical protein
MESLLNVTRADIALAIPELAGQPPECGIRPPRPPADTRVRCQHGKFLHRMQPFSGLLKKSNIVTIGLACTIRHIEILIDIKCVPSIVLSDHFAQSEDESRKARTG